MRSRWRRWRRSSPPWRRGSCWHWRATSGRGSPQGGGSSACGGGAHCAAGRGRAAGTRAAPAGAARRGGLTRRARGVSQGAWKKTLRVDKPHPAVRRAAATLCRKTRRRAPGRAWRACTRSTGALFVCERAFAALAVVALFGVQGWRWARAREVRDLVFALDANTAGQQQWRQLARQAALRGKRVAGLEAAAYGGWKDVNEAWVAGTPHVQGGDRNTKPLFTRTHPLAPPRTPPAPPRAPGSYPPAAPERPRRGVPRGRRRAW
jgi:hypothetical protein